MKTKIQLLLIAGLFFTGCSSVAYLPTNDEKTTYTPTSSSAIEIYSTDDAGKDYLIIGEVIASADAGADASISVNHLKKQAAKLGADGIINLKLEIGYGYWSNAIRATGTAVKFVDK